MTTSLPTLKPSLLFFVFLLALFGEAQTTASYMVTFTSEWNASDHNNGNALPGNAHFSKLVGAVHDASISYWEPGQLASLGIENIAEIGNNDAFFSTVQSNISLGNTQQYIDGEDLPSATGSVMVRIMDVSADHPLITLASMIAPSPDWFIGVHDLSLIDTNGNWIDTLTIDLYAYDAGTENDAIFYSLNNVPTVPQGVITNKTNMAPFNAVRIGTLTITMDTTLNTDTLEANALKIFPNPSNGLVQVDIGNGQQLQQIHIYDVLGKQVNKLTVFRSNNSHLLDLRHLNPGIYLTKLRMKNGSETTKKIIIH